MKAALQLRTSINVPSVFREINGISYCFNLLFCTNVCSPLQPVNVLEKGVERDTLNRYQV